jgi:diphthamide biosynthesis enzyme Dph1/Dph2-like protein
MKKLFIETRRKFSKKNVEFNILDKIPGKTMSLAATIQYLDLIPLVKEYLESKGNKVILKKGPFYEAQVLGCQAQAFDKKADTLILITDGKFHALNNAIQLNREIYVFNTKSLEKVTKEDLEENKKKIKGKQNKFLTYNNIGLIISSKPGQHYKQFEEIAKKIEKLGKNTYIFETDNINLEEFENFPNIKMWVNTACSGLGLDDPRIINLRDILEFL